MWKTALAAHLTDHPDVVRSMAAMHADRKQLPQMNESLVVDLLNAVRKSGLTHDDASDDDATLVEEPWSKMHASDYGVPTGEAPTPSLHDRTPDRGDKRPTDRAILPAGRTKLPARGPVRDALQAASDHAACPEPDRRTASVSPRNAISIVRKTIAASDLGGC